MKITEGAVIYKLCFTELCSYTGVRPIMFHLQWTIPPKLGSTFRLNASIRELIVSK